MNRINARVGATCLAAALLAGGLAGCASVSSGGSTVGMLATDRRSEATQAADDRIEKAAATRVSEALGGNGHFNVNSYYRKLLLTGEVPTEPDRQRAHAAAAGTPEVAGVVNELAVMANSSLLQRSDDALTTGKVKSNLMRANGVPNSSIKVVTERNVTYLMGRLTERETALATEVARTTSGVERVVRLIDFIADTSAPGAAAVPAVPAALPGPAAPATAQGVVTSPVTQPTIVQQPPPIQVQTLPPVK